MYFEEELLISTLGRKRKVRIFLPTDYEVSDKQYPVVYMHDGQNLIKNEHSFGGASWEIDHFVEQSENQKGIIIGIDNGEIYRYNEYSPVLGSERGKELAHVNSFEHFGGEGTKYLEWLVKELKPFIDKKYRTLSDAKNTSIIGSSMGAYISFFAGIYYPETFGNIGLLSPAFWFNKDFLMEELTKNKFNPKAKLIMTIGTDENNPDYLPDAKEMNELLRKNYALDFLIEDGGQHNEETWAKQIPAILNTFLSEEER